MSRNATRPTLGGMSQFPLLQESLKDDPRSLRNAGSALSLLSGGLEAGEIANARYNDAKHDLARAVEKCWRHWVASRWPNRKAYDVDWHVSFGSVSSYIGLADIPRLPKKMAAIRKTGITAKEIIDLVEVGERVAKELAPIYEAFAWLKPRCVKISRTRAPIPQEDMLPQATLAARKLVRGVMAEALDRVRSEYLESMKVSVSQQADHFGDEILWKQRDSLNFADPQLISAAFDSVSGNANILYRRRRDARARLAKYAERIVEAVFDGFLTKNVEKIAAIIELKGDEAPEIELKQAEVDGRSLITAMKFAFADGSSFEARNSIVHQYSGHGKPYVRFPTTFHNAVMANGNPIRSPSEEEMKTVFVAAENASATLRK